MSKAECFKDLRIWQEARQLVKLVYADFARFLNIAKGSAGEVRSMYYSAEDLMYVSEETANERRVAAKGISQGIGALEGYLRK